MSRVFCILRDLSGQELYQIPVEPEQAAALTHIVKKHRGEVQEFHLYGVKANGDHVFIHSPYSARAVFVVGMDGEDDE